MTRDPVKIITALAKQLPALRKAPGLDPWEPEVLDEWAASGGPSLGERAVVRFLPAVWNGSEDYWKSGPFRMRDIEILDEKNLEAWKTWAARPFFL